MARALVRNNEVYREADWSAFTKNHIEWHTTANPDGDGYALAEDCPADAVASDFDLSSYKETLTSDPPQFVTRLTAVLNTRRYSARISGEETVTETEEETHAESETIVIDGVTYTRSS